MAEQAGQAPQQPPAEARNGAPAERDADNDDAVAAAEKDSAAPSASPAAAAPAGPVFGRERFLLLRQKWLTPNPNVTPRPVPADPMDEDDIIDAVTGCPGDVLEPVVHLPYMAEALSMMWEEDGLYN
jgi:hypothetical protein